MIVDIHAKFVEIPHTSHLCNLCVEKKMCKCAMQICTSSIILFFCYKIKIDMKLKKKICMQNKKDSTTQMF